MQFAEFIHFWLLFVLCSIAQPVPVFDADAKSLREFRPGLNVRPNRFFRNFLLI
jgi:hypothetical protein